jgi:hypothetical protein
MTLKFNLWPAAGQDVVIRKIKPKTDIATGEVLDGHPILIAHRLAGVAHRIGAASHPLSIKICLSGCGSTTRRCL